MQPFVSNVKVTFTQPLATSCLCLKYCSWNLIFLDPVSIKFSINDSCVCCIHTLLIQPFMLSNPSCTVIFVSTIFKTLRWSPWLSIPGFHSPGSISCSYVSINTLLCPESIATVMQYNNRMLLTDNCPGLSLSLSKQAGIFQKPSMTHLLVWN